MRRQMFGLALLCASLVLAQQASAHGRESDQWVTGAVVGAVVGGVIAATRPQPIHYPPAVVHYHHPPQVVYYAPPVHAGARHKHKRHRHQGRHYSGHHKPHYHR